MTESIGQKLKEIRVARGISLRALAAEVGIHFGSLSKIENGKEGCSSETLTRLAMALDTDVNLVLGYAGHRTLPYRVLGNIAAGTPIETTEHVETFDLAEQFDPRTHFMLKVRGDSMILAGINDGDLAIIRHESKPRNGQIVAAVVGDEEATLKTYSQEDGWIVLSPANRSLKPKRYQTSQVDIRGVMVGVVRTRVP